MGFNSGFKGLKQTLTQTRFSFKSTHRKSKITRSTHRNKHPLTSKTGSYGCKTHWTDKNDGDTTVFHGRELFYLPFSVLSVREILDKSSHALIFICLFFCWETARSSPGRFILQVSRSHTIRHTHLVRLLWNSDQPLAEAATYKTPNTYTRGENPRTQRDSKPRFQQSSGRRPTP